MQRDLIHDLRAALGSDAISDDMFARRAMARDASLYRMVPTAVVRPSTSTDIVNLFSVARKHGASCTFRAAGTSLSGQAVTNGLLIDISRSWSAAEVLDGGERIRLQPSVTGGRANALLRRYGRRIGPDPASLMACMVGGIVANNASGMCCGTAHNSYHTIDSMRYILADGTLCDTSDPHVDDRLSVSNPDVAVGIAALRDEVRANADLVSLIRRKYRIKNTVGYGLNAFLDEDRPSKIIAKLMVGSEGTLGFIDEVVFRTIVDARVKHTAIMVYASLEAACDDVAFWRERGAAAVELMDDASLQSFAMLSTTPPELRITQKGAAALLVEFHDVEPPDRPFDGYATEWTTDPKRQAQLWHLRKGLMPTVGAMRPPGTTMINEDVAVPPERLAELVRGVQASFARFGYNDGIIFGHAKDGNIHFVVNQRFDTDEDIARYADFMDDIACIVTGLDGSLKAEHGTGRNMAPFVEREWGTVAYRIMQRVKSILDPNDILNPGVVINTDAHVHIRNLKPVPTVDASVNACIECGFCEHVCPTRSYTLTPRQRIAMLREQAVEDDPEIRRALERAYHAQAIDSCSVDGMCGTVCPVGIDTGAFVKERRAADRSTLQHRLATSMARRMALVDKAARATVSTIHALGSIVGHARIAAVSRRIHDIIPSVPTWYASAGKPVRAARSMEGEPDLVVMPACGSRWMGHRHGTSSIDLLLEICSRAGLRVHLIPSKGAMCCGQLFDSKGLTQAAADVRRHTLERLRQDVVPGVPIVVDASTCAAALAHEAGDQQVYDLVGALRHVILPRCTIHQRMQHVGLHPGCGTAKLRQQDDLMAIANACADRVTIPASAACCGMAGDAGMRDPLIVASALRDVKTQVEASHDVEGWYSVNPTCEIALEEHLQRRVESIVALVAKVTRPRETAAPSR